MHKYRNGKVPLSFENFFTPIGQPNRTNGYQVDKARIDFLYQFPSYFLPKNWNENNLSLKSNPSHTNFKEHLYSSLISKYPPAIKCKDRKCPDCFPPVIYLQR